MWDIWNFYKDLFAWLWSAPAMPTPPPTPITAPTIDPDAVIIPYKSALPPQIPPGMIVLPAAEVP
jgi:hypothetical protein